MGTGYALRFGTITRMPTILEELSDWLRIPSVSTGGGDAAALKRSAEWVCERIEAAGGTAEAVSLDGGHPMAIGELRANRADAPTVLAYGHHDVQNVGREDDWDIAAVRAQRARRAPLRARRRRRQGQLPAAAPRGLRARAGGRAAGERALPRGGRGGGRAPASVMRWIREDERGADAALVFDLMMADEATPAITVATRGLVAADVEVRTAARDLHSGVYGGRRPQRRARAHADARRGRAGRGRARAARS